MDSDNEKKLVDQLNSLLPQINDLGEWSPSNAGKLDRINRKFLEVGCEMLEMVNQNPSSFIMQKDDTTTEVGRAQGTFTKNKKDLVFYEKYYSKAIRHLKEEIPGFIETYYIYKARSGNESDKPISLDNQ